MATRKFANMETQRLHDRTHAAKAPAVEHAEGMHEGHEPHETLDNHENVVAEHGKAHTIHIKHDHAANKHTVHSIHESGHEHHAEFDAAAHAHDHAAKMAGVESGHADEKQDQDMMAGAANEGPSLIPSEAE